MKKVSIIVPVYNEEKYLCACVNSILNQTYKNIEVILVDDGSTNDAGKICDAISLTDTRIRVIHKRNQGLSAARLTGLDASTGDWLMFVDNDDIISPYMVEDMIKNADENTDIVSGKREDLELVDEFIFKSNDKNVISLSGYETVEKIPSDTQQLIVTPLWGKIYKKEFILNIDVRQYMNSCPILFFEDIFMTPIILSKAKEVKLLDNVYYIHREVMTSISRSGKLSNYYYEQIYSGEILLKYLHDNNLNQYYTYFLSLYIWSILRIWALIEFYDLDTELKNTYKSDIKLRYNKYRKEYIRTTGDSFFKKIVFKSFRVNPRLWGIIVRKFYYKRRGKNGN